MLSDGRVLSDGMTKSTFRWDDILKGYEGLTSENGCGKMAKNKRGSFGKVTGTRRWSVLSISLIRVWSMAKLSLKRNVLVKNSTHF